MGYWIYTPEQGERIRAGENAARRQFFEENKEKITSTVKHFIRYYEPWKEDLNGYINACYVDMHNWRFDKSDTAITYGLRKTLLQTRLTHSEYLLSEDVGLANLPVKYNLITEVDGKRDECIVDLYYTDSIDIDSFENLTPEAVATFFLPYFKNKRITDVVYLLCCGHGINSACREAGISEKYAITQLRTVFCERFFEFVEFLKTHGGNPEILLSRSSDVQELSEKLEERHKLELERKKMYKKLARERKKAQAV